MSRGSSEGDLTASVLQFTIEVPFEPVTVTWIQDGAALLVNDKTAFCIGFVVPEELLGHRNEASMIQEDKFMAAQY